jgi:hypothetical protein
MAKNYTLYQGKSQRIHLHKIKKGGGSSALEYGKNLHQN